MNNNTLNDTISDDVSVQVTETTVGPKGPEYDYVFSFFSKVMKDKSAALSFTHAMYEVAYATETPILELLEPLDGADEMTLSATLAYYLNTARSPATLLGVNVIVKPNYYAARNVLS